MKILTGSDATITSPTFVAADGYTAADTATDPTVTAVSAAGQTVTLGTVVDIAAEGVYTVTVQGLAGPDLLTLTWVGAVSGADQRYVQQIDVVGGVYASLPELAAIPGVDHPNKHSTARLLELRDEFEDLAERWTGQAWVPRFAQETLRNTILLNFPQPRSIVSVVDSQSVTIDATSWELAEWGGLTDGFGGSITGYGIWPLTVKYVHGADRPPADLVGACKQYVRSKLLADNSRIGRDTLSQTDPAGITERWSTPDWNAGRPTGLLDVDRVLCSLGAPLPGIA